MTSQALLENLFSNSPYYTPSPIGKAQRVSFPSLFHSQLDVILTTNFSIIIAHCFVVIYSEGTYWTESQQMMKRTASMDAKLFGNCNYSQSTSDDCVQHSLP